MSNPKKHPLSKIYAKVADGTQQVYCGDCARKENRRTSSSKKKGKNTAANSEAKPLSQCLVSGCTSKLSASKTMIQLFL